jgi:hypothetical protein
MAGRARRRAGQQSGRWQAGRRNRSEPRAAGGHAAALRPPPPAPRQRSPMSPRQPPACGPSTTQPRPRHRLPAAGTPRHLSTGPQQLDLVCTTPPPPARTQQADASQHTGLAQPNWAGSTTPALLPRLWPESPGWRSGERRHPRSGPAHKGQHRDPHAAAAAANPATPACSMCPRGHPVGHQHHVTKLIRTVNGGTDAC